jgi:hypothetical protein
MRWKYTPNIAYQIYEILYDNEFYGRSQICTQFEIRYIYTLGIVKSERLEKKVYSVYLYYFFYYKDQRMWCFALNRLDFFND